MRKIIAIPLLFIYALTISGMVIRAHYCGKHLMSISFFAGKDKCGECDNAGKKKCCKDKVVCFQVSHEQNIVKAFTVNAPQVFIAPKVSYPIPDKVSFNEASAQLIHMPNAPPGLWQRIPLYKLQSRIVYYG